MQMIGHQPAIKELNLIDGQDLTHRFIAAGDPLPAGSVVLMQAYTRDFDHTYGAWPVTLTADGWVLHVAAADHASIPHGARFRVYVHYPSAGRYCWISGPVARNRR